MQWTRQTSHAWKFSDVENVGAGPDRQRAPGTLTRGSVHPSLGLRNDKVNNRTAHRRRQASVARSTSQTSPEATALHEGSFTVGLILLANPFHQGFWPLAPWLPSQRGIAAESGADSGTLPVPGSPSHHLPRANTSLARWQHIRKTSPGGAGRSAEVGAAGGQDPGPVGLQKEIDSGLPTHPSDQPA